MSCRFWSFAAALSAAVVLSGAIVAGAVDDAPAGSAPAEQSSNDASAESKPTIADAAEQKANPITDAKGIEAALKKKIDAKLVQMPLLEFARWIEEKHGVHVEVDKKSLIDAGLDPEAIELNFDERNLALGLVLHHVLPNHDLSWVVTNEAIQFTTAERANVLVETRVYPAIDLLAFRQADGSVREDVNLLMLLIQGMCSPESWQTTGGEGRINTHDGLLSVSQNRFVHEQIAMLLETLRAAKQAAAEGNLTVTRAAGDDAEVYAAVNSATIEPDWKGVGLPEFMDRLQDAIKMPVIIDVRSLTDSGIGNESIEFWLKCHRIPVRTALARTMPQSNLAYVVEKGALVITAAERASLKLEVDAYPIGDLLSDELKIGESQIQRGRGLQALIMDAADPATWNDNGGPSRIEFAAPWNLLVVSAPAATQQKVADVLAKLRDAKQQQAESGLEPGDAATTDDLVLLRVFKLGSVAGGDQEAADKIAELVRELVPETRSNEPDNPEGPYLRTVGDRMVVMNRRSVLVKVESLLDQFDSASGGKHSKATASAGEPAASK